MNNDVRSVVPLPDFRLKVELVDGRSGVFDLGTHLRNPGLRALSDPAYFAKAGVLCGAVTWPNGEDIAPDTLAAELQVSVSA